MPDISRSDSNRSDASRPRVSFNRDVHVKRINSPRLANAYSLSSDGTSLVPTSIRRERPLTKKEMTKEAEAVLKHVDKVSCTATSNVKLETEKRKPKKNRKESFMFIKKSDKPEKTKSSSSDVESASSQEYRIYKVNDPLNNDLGDRNLFTTNKKPKQNANFRNKSKGTERKMYEFMSLDRKKLKRDKQNKNLDYLSLEKNNANIGKTKAETENVTKESINHYKDEFKFKERNASPSNRQPDTKESVRLKPKLIITAADDLGKRKPLSPIIESPGVNYSARKIENNVGKMVKILNENSPSKLKKNTGVKGVREPEAEFCHNDNLPFSYTNGNKNEPDFKLNSTNVENLGDDREDFKFASPTNDVIYAQVVVGGRDGNVQKTAVNKRVASTEVERVFVGEESNQSGVGSNYKINSIRNDDICERLTVNSDEMWQTRSDYHAEKKERISSSRRTPPEMYENNQDRREIFYRKPVDTDNISNSLSNKNKYTRVIKVESNFEESKLGNRSSSDLHDLSIRREILLSRSESQAKERFNSLKSAKRLQESGRIRRHVSNVNEIKSEIRTERNREKQLENDTRVIDKFKLQEEPKKIPKIVEGGESDEKKKRQSKLDHYLKDKEKEEKWKNSDKIHVIVTDDDENLLRKLTRIGKNKTLPEEKPKSKKVDKVKSLFKKKKERRWSESEDDPLSSRYIEYRGSDVEHSDRSTDSSPKRSLVRSHAEPLVSTLIFTFSLKYEISLKPKK